MLKDVGIHRRLRACSLHTKTTNDRQDPHNTQLQKQYSMIVQNQGKFWMILESNEILTEPPATSADLVHSVTSLRGHLFNKTTSL